MRTKRFLIIIISICLGLVAYVTIYNLLFGNWCKYICNNKYESDTTDPKRFKSPDEYYRRDSLFIVLTVKQFVNNGIYPFDFFKQFNIPEQMVHFEVDSIIYSPDRLKFFAFLIQHAPESNTVYSNKPEYFFSEYTLIGYRTKKDEIWKIYSDYYKSVLNSYNDNRNTFRKYYFGDGKFKYDSDYYWDSSIQDRISIPFKYNLDDLKFWDSSIVWQKGSRIPGYYGFETTGNVKPGEENAIKNLPNFQYSDSLLKLYK